IRTTLTELLECCKGCIAFSREVSVTHVVVVHSVKGGQQMFQAIGGTRALSFYIGIRSIRCFLGTVVSWLLCIMCDGRSLGGCRAGCVIGFRTCATACEN